MWIFRNGVSSLWMSVLGRFWLSTLLPLPSWPPCFVWLEPVSRQRHEIAVVKSWDILPFHKCCQTLFEKHHDQFHSYQQWKRCLLPWSCYQQSLLRKFGRFCRLDEWKMLPQCCLTCISWMTRAAKPVRYLNGPLQFLWGELSVPGDHSFFSRVVYLSLSL